MVDEDVDGQIQRWLDFVQEIEDREYSKSLLNPEKTSNQDGGQDG